MIAGISNFPTAGGISTYPSATPTLAVAPAAVPASVLALIAAISGVIAFIGGKLTLDEFQRQDQEAKVPLLPNLSVGRQRETEIEPPSPGNPTGYHGGSSQVQNWWRVFQRANVSNGEFTGWGTITWAFAGNNTFYASDLVVIDTPDEDFTHFSFNNSPLSEDPYIGSASKNYFLRERPGAGSFSDVLLGTFFGCRFLGYSGTNGVLPDTNDPVYYEGTATDPVTTAADAGKAVMPAPTEIEQLLEENQALYEFLVRQNDQILDLSTIAVLNQRLQVEIFAEIADNLANQIQNGFDFILEQLGALETLIIEPVTVSELPNAPTPPTLPDFAPPAVPASEPLLLPDGGEALLLPPTETNIAFVPSDQRENRWNPPLLAIPEQRIPLAIANIQDCVCFGLSSCCELIFSRIIEVKDVADDIVEDTENIEWEINPPLPGSSDLAATAFVSTSGGTWQNVGKLIWVFLTQTVAPSGRVKVTFANNSGPSVQYVGWFSWNVDGKWTPKNGMTWEQGAFIAPKGAIGFQFTATHGARYSGVYYTDNRSS